MTNLDFFKPFFKLVPVFLVVQIVQIFQIVKLQSVWQNELKQSIV